MKLKYKNNILMEIYKMLPDEIQNNVKYYILEHPTAKIKIGRAHV